MVGRFVANPERLGENLERLADFGRFSSGGVGRLAFTQEDVDARRYVIGLMEDAGLRVRVDPFGNVFGRRDGAGPAALPAVASGSHIDGPPYGGKYDGTIGILTAIEALRMIRAQGIETKHPIEAVATACEHMDRFGVGCLGGRAIAGLLAEQELHTLKDSDGVTLWDALRGAGLHPERIAEARQSRETLKCFLELHIEQGRVLEDAGKRIGIVTAIAAATRTNVTVTGVADHSGGTPMRLRRDALVAAAELIVALERFANEEARYGSVGTVGVIRAEPGAAHTIPGLVELQTDIRGVDPASKRRLVDRFRREVDSLPLRRPVQVASKTPVDWEPVPCTESIVEALKRSCDDLGVDALVMQSGGGHDAQHIAAVTDIGMLFVPSVAGISHSPEEYTTIEDLCYGSELLAECLVRLAGAKS